MADSSTHTSVLDKDLQSATSEQLKQGIIWRLEEITQSSARTEQIIRNLPEAVLPDHFMIEIIKNLQEILVNLETLEHKLQN